MKAIDFVKKYYSFAKECQDRTHIPATFTLAQAALESGWGEHAPGNMFFGIKDHDGINGNEQLLQTVEYSKNETLKVPIIISKVFDPVKKLYKFIVKDYFRKYNNPEESFEDHAKLFISNVRYKGAFKCGFDPYCFADNIALAGYATDPNYSSKIKSIIIIIEKVIKDEKL